MHIKVSCGNEGCNLSLLVRQLINYLKEENYFDKRKTFFIDNCFNNRDIIQPLLFLYKNQYNCSELLNIFNF